jgi:RimJ/RimL family protein N-acetyltransferase
MHPEITSAPDVETARLLLRGHRREDLADSLAMWSDPRVTRHIGGVPSSEERTWARLLGYRGHWTFTGYGYWLVEERASGRFVGEVGFADFKRDVTPSLGGAPEAGWALAPWAHGKGYATEALGAATAWLEGLLGKVRTVCMIDPQNTPSLRLALRAGYREWARTTYRGEATVLLERAPE